MSQPLLCNFSLWVIQQVTQRHPEGEWDLEAQSELDSNPSCMVLGTFFLYVCIPSLKVQVSIGTQKAIDSEYLLQVHRHRHPTLTELLGNFISLCPILEKSTDDVKAPVRGHSSSVKAGWSEAGGHRMILRIFKTGTRDSRRSQPREGQGEVAERELQTKTTAYGV